MSKHRNTQSPEKIFLQHGGQLRMSEAIKAGISRYTLYQMRDNGLLEQVSRGIYRLVSLPPMEYPDLVTVSLRFPKAVICLISALSFHEMTTQIPREVSLAVPRGTRMPFLDNPPVHSYRFSVESFNIGIEKHQLDGAVVQIYNPEKTLVDCFKYRNKLGMEVVLEALQYYRSKKSFHITKLLQYARVCRVAEVMKPYLEASL